MHPVMLIDLVTLCYTATSPVLHSRRYPRPQDDGHLRAFHHPKEPTPQTRPLPPCALMIINVTLTKMGSEGSTHHPPSLRPNTKSMHASSSLRWSNPVNVAHCPPTNGRGATTRKSRMTSSGSFSEGEEPAAGLGREGSGKRRAKMSGTVGA